MRRPLGACLCVALIGFSSAAGADWNAAGDFSAASNPAGAWSYGSRANLEDTALIVHDTFSTELPAFTATGPLSIWNGPSPDFYGLPFVLRNESGSAVTIESDPEVVVPAGRLMMHPGTSAPGDDDNAFSVVRWTAAAGGVYRVNATFYGMDIGSTDVHVVVNGVSTYDAVRSDVGDNRAYSTLLSIAPGDTVDFVVGNDFDGSFDSTGLDASIVTFQGDIAFQDFTNVACLQFEGSAAQAGDVLRLTTSAEGQSGAAWYACQKAHLADGFDSYFEFRMWDPSDGADGMAFLIQDSSTNELGGGGSDLGYAGISRSLAVELDTFGFFPESDNNIAVHSLGNSGNSSDPVLALAMVDPATDLNDGNPHVLRIYYEPGTLSVYLDDMFTPVLTMALNLQNISGDDILDETGDAWVGFTGATGGVYQTHDVHNWNLSRLGPPGACCTGEGCIQATAQGCAAQDGYFQGEDSLCSNPFLDCENLGRCCFTDGTCTTTSVAYCFDVLSGPLFSTPGVCGDFDCPSYGACCNDESSCSLGWDFECTDPGEVFLGAGTTCTPDPCGPCVCPGDMNGDSALDGADVQQFVACYMAAGGGGPTPGCNCADVDPSGAIDGADTAAFVARLLGGDSCD